MYCIYLVLYLPCIVFTMYCIYHVLYLPCTVFTMYCIYHALYLACTVFTLYCIYHVLYLLGTVFTMYCIYLCNQQSRCFSDTMSKENSPYFLVEHHLKQRPIPENNNHSNFWRNSKTKMEMDRSHLPNATRLHPQGCTKMNSSRKKPRGRPRETWRRSISREMTAKGWSWGQVERWAADREHWRTLVMAFRANQPEED